MKIESKNHEWPLNNMLFHLIAAESQVWGLPVQSLQVYPVYELNFSGFSSDKKHELNAK